MGEFEAKRVMGANPYAALMSTSRIEELESHKSSAIAKRASRIWRQHFVTCAICGLSYSKHSPEVTQNERLPSKFALIISFRCRLFSVMSASAMCVSIAIVQCFICRIKSNFGGK